MIAKNLKGNTKISPIITPKKIEATPKSVNLSKIIELETVTDINKLRIYTNRIKSVYGKTNLNNYIKKNINQNEFVKIYEQKKNKVWV